jgi:hypothetical protein
MRSNGVPGEACPENEELFESSVWEPVLSQNCVLCHVDGGQADSSGFVLRQEGDGKNWLKRNMEAVERVANELEDGTPILLLKPTGLHSDGHGGGNIISPESEEYETLEYYASWVRGELEECDEYGFGSCEEDVPGPRLLRRLTHSAYDHTVQDLLGVESSYGSEMAVDNVVNGFFNNAEALQVPFLLADQYRTAAESLAEQATLFHLDTLLTCDVAEQGEAMCAAEFVRDFGKKAFRRPLQQDELDRYWNLFDTIAQEDGFTEGIRWVITAMIQSPHFLYRAELGAHLAGELFELSDWEIATELSYLLWDTMPDEELFAKAEAGVLHTEEQISFEVERMLADPKASRVMSTFVQQWLHLDRLVKVPKIMTVYPELTFDMRHEMLGETERLAANLFHSGGTLEELFVADYSYMTDELATYYGLAPGGGEMDTEGYRRVDLSSSPYGGLLTQGALLTTFASPDNSSPVHRGVVVRERVLCQELPPPPANLEIKPPETDPEKTVREQYAQHAADPACSDCHSRIDPIGFGFEHFDGAGVYREMDGIHDIDDSGEVVQAGSANGPFEGVNELSVLLGQSDEVQECYVDMWVTYGLGMFDSSASTCASGLIASNNNGGSISLSAPLQGVTQLNHFTARQGEPGESDGPEGDGGLVFDAFSEVDNSRYPSDGSGSGGGGGGGGDGLVFTLNEVSRWDSGYCADGIVENPTDSPMIWEVSATLEGSINNLWNANKREDGSLTWFTGLSWNSEVAAGGSQTFGFCADL